VQIRPNRAKEILNAGGTLFTSSVRLPEPGLCELLGYAGFDFVLLDGEHGAADAATIDRLIQGCFAGNTVPIVRVLRNDDPEAVMHALDLGAQGILMPHCRSAADARRLKRAALYPPSGNRGFGPGRGTLWGRVALDEYFETINDTILLLALIEDPEGVDLIDEIAPCGIDVLWVGTGDLAMAYGVPGQRQHPRVLEAAAKVLAACQRHNVAAGFPVGSLEEARWARDQGYRAIGFGGAEQYVMQASRQFLEPLGR
jgi:2-keto-3-deoxy-L-rhamnonate aldolase RhmA